MEDIRPSNKTKRSSLWSDDALMVSADGATSSIPKLGDENLTPGAKKGAAAAGKASTRGKGKKEMNAKGMKPITSFFSVQK